MSTHLPNSAYYQAECERMDNPPADPLDEPILFIVCAAIRHRRNGLVLCGARHYDPVMVAMIRHLAAWTALKNAGDEFIERERDWVDADQGFLDNRGQFWTREEAWRIAEKAGQIRNPQVTQGRAGILYSEHLY